MAVPVAWAVAFWAVASCGSSTDCFHMKWTEGLKFRGCGGGVLSGRRGSSRIVRLAERARS